MKLRIPPLGTLLKLSVDWTFDLWVESRNDSLWQAVAPNEDTRDYIEQREIATTPWSDEEIKSYRLLYPSGWLNAQINAGARPVHSRYVTTREARPLIVTLPKGTVLQVDRIYIRKGLDGFDSVSFRIAKGNTIHPQGKALRFWAKLHDVNRIEIADNVQWTDDWPRLDGWYWVRTHDGINYADPVPVRVYHDAHGTPVYVSRGSVLYPSMNKGAVFTPIIPPDML